MKKILMVVGLWWWSVAAVAAAPEWTIDNFASRIELNRDTSLTVEERIETNFLIPKHGIYRFVPDIYSRDGKTIRAIIKVENVTDENGNKYKYELSRQNQSLKMTIGDANVTLTGKRIYKIRYKVEKVVLIYNQEPEIYWNVTGSEWEVPIKKVSAEIVSPWAKVKEIRSYNGEGKVTENGADFTANGAGLTVAVRLNKDNQLIWPSELKKWWWKILDNWGYPLAALPIIVMVWAWYTKGRDKRYLSENVFYKQKGERKVGIWERPHLPLVYGEVNGLTPAEVGTILDEKVDTKDIVAEILELGRLGYLKIEKIEEKGFLGIKTTDYKLTKLEPNNPKTLKDYQEFLLEKLFEGKETVKISDLKNKFYVHLNKIREKVYSGLAKDEAFSENPSTTRVKWGGITVGLNAAALVAIVFFSAGTDNFGPLGWWVWGAIPSLALAWFMPRKTAWGYSLHRQAVGLKYYMEKGKWREEIAEKKLFVAETLPLAVALGVVNKLAADMKELEMTPPDYFSGVTVSTFTHDLGSFSSSAASSLVSTPSSSGHSSWSGGSGFSGGGGGGFGGGGGGSW